MTPYEILGVTPSSTLEEIKAAYRRACMTTHPDRGGTPEAFDAVHRAYRALSRRPCATCGGKGWVAKRQGAFVRRDQCPECWKST